MAEHDLEKLGLVGIDHLNGQSKSGRCKNILNGA